MQLFVVLALRIPTVGELRAGTLEILIDNPLSEGHNEDDSYYIGSIPVTEVESVFSVDSTKNGKAHLSFEVGYGLVMGHLKTKAIAMSVWTSASIKVISSIPPKMKNSSCTTSMV